MPVEMIGWIAPRVSSEIIPPSGPPFDAGVVAETARIHERAGFDRVLIGYFSDAPDGFLVGAHAAAVTERLGFLLAHRPGFVAPPLAARKLATLDQLSGGRLAVHIISGGSDADQAKDGDWTDHEARYRRSAEYIDAAAPHLDRAGAVRPSRASSTGPAAPMSEIRCRQEPHIPIYGGGGSDAAIRALAPHVDVFMLWGEPLKETARVHGPGAARGGAVRPQPDLQPVDPPDPGGDRGRRLGPRARDPRPGAAQPRRRAAAEAPECRLAAAVAGRRRSRGARHLPVDAARRRDRRAGQLDRAGRHARRRSPRRCSNITSSAPPRLLIRGYDPRPDAVQYGEELIPRIRALVARTRRRSGSVAQAS